MRALVFSAFLSACLLSYTPSFAQEETLQKKGDICQVLQDEILGYRETKVRKKVGLGSSSSSETSLSQLWSNALFSRVGPLISIYKDLGCDTSDLRSKLDELLSE